MFPNFIGQHRWQKFFSSALVRATLAPAYLFVGPEHLGKRTFMRVLTRGLICRAVDAHGAACGSCVACRAWRQEMHPDCVELAPNEKGLVSVDEVRTFIAELYRSRSCGLRRVALIPEAEWCSVAAVNALLKILEEPPQSVVFLVRATDADQLPATLRSRLQVCRFAPVSVVLLTETLEQQGVERSSARELARLSEGRPGLALSWLSDNEALNAYRARAAQFATLLNASLAERFAFTETVATEEKCSRRELVALTNEWLRVLRDQYLRAVNLPERARQDSSAPATDVISVASTPKRYATACLQLAEARRHLEHYANRRLSLNTFFLHV